MKYGTKGSAVEVNIPTRAALFRAVEEKFARGDGSALATLNLDHLTKLPVDASFAQAYRAHDLVVADGRPVVWLSQLANQPLELMPGSDLVLPLTETAARMKMPVALMGSSDAALAGAKAALEAQAPDVDIVMAHAPLMALTPPAMMRPEFAIC